MIDTTGRHKCISQKCQEFKDTYPDVLERWKKFGDPFQKAAVAVIEAGIRGDFREKP